MTNQEKLKDAYEKLKCFDNPLLQDIASQVEDAYNHLYGNRSELNSIIIDIARLHGYTKKDILEGGRKKELVYLRYLISKCGKENGFDPPEIAEALQMNRASVRYYLEGYKPPIE